MSDRKLLITEHHNRIYTLLLAHNKLLDIYVSDKAKASLVGNIYIGKVQNISQNIQAAFVEIRKDELCFLPLSECKSAYILNRQAHDHDIRTGDELLVQVIRDAVKTKQPSLSTAITLTGKYILLTSDGRKVGISNKINIHQKQYILDFMLEHHMINESRECIGCDYDYSMIIRTNAGTLTDMSSLYHEWENLTTQYSTVLKEAHYRTCFSCVKKVDKPYLEQLKNYYQTEYDEIVTDSKAIYAELCEINLCGNHENSTICSANIRLYEDEYPLAKLYNLRKLIEEALNKRVWLKSGGYLIIEPTEALTAIDVNTGKYEAGKHNDETFYKINMEAAKEISIQMRLRNLSGMIIVDFINMKDETKKQNLMNELRELVKTDSIPTKVIDMTSLGLVEITRKRVNRPLRELIEEF